MGCASSTPMVATAGSEMLKAATHVASDATKSAEDAAKDVSQALGKTLDNAKETVSTAVTGIAQDLGSVFKDKTNELDAAKDDLMQKLQPQIADSSTSANADEAEDAVATTIKHVHEEAEHANENSASRAPTPAPAPDSHDTDSLRTSTPEPEIEHALANATDDKPPTPKPTLAELEQLSVTAIALTNIITTAATVPALSSAATETPHATNEDTEDTVKAEQAEKAVTPPVKQPTDVEQHRPSTTEWEKYADTLAHAQKFNPREPYPRGGKAPRVFGQQLHPPLPPWGESHQPTNTAAVPYSRRLRHEDSTLSDANGYSQSSPQHTNRPSAIGLRKKLPHTLTRTTARKFQRDFSNLLGTDRAGRQLRTQSKSPAPGRKFDFNPNRSRIGSSPVKARSLTRSRVGSPIHTKTVLLSGLTSPVRSRAVVRSRVTSPVQGRAFSIRSVVNTKPLPLRTRSQLNSPVRTRALIQARLNSPSKAKRAVSQTHLNSSASSHTNLGSPVRVTALTPTKTTKHAAMTRSHTDLVSPLPIETVDPNELPTSKPTFTTQSDSLNLLSSPNKTNHSSQANDKAALKEHMLAQNKMSSPTKLDSRSRSSRSSTNSSIVIKSNRTSPSNHSPMTHDDMRQMLQQQQVSSAECSRSHTPSMELFSTDGRTTPLGVFLANDSRNTLTSSFLSTPRTSPFSIRKEYADGSDKENKYMFVSDLSSVSESRMLLSPYKLRDRCLVCHKKYVIK